MKRTWLKKQIRGFSTVEAVMGAALLSSVGIMAGRMMVNSNVSMMATRQNARANTLADSIFEQYNAFAMTNFQALATYDKQNVAVSDFFGSHATEGPFSGADYKNLSLSSRATFASDRSSCDIALEVSWLQAGQLKSAVYHKTYAETPPLKGGGTVEIWVRPCPTCPGFEGFELSAPSAFSSTDIRSVTDATGHAFLKNVKLGDAIIVKASKAASSYANSAFVQGYYVPDGFGGYSNNMTFSLSVTEAGPNRVEFDQFLPLGTVKGTLSNLAGSEHPVEGMTVSLTGKVAKGDGTFRQCNGDCSVTTDTDGHYYFKNVVPGSVHLDVQGRDGSDPTVQPNNSAFSWGYVGSPAAYDSTLMAASSVNPVPPDASVDVAIQRKGWVAVHAVVGSTGLDVSGAQLRLSLDGVDYALVADITGRGRFYNVLAKSPVTLDTWGYRAPQQGSQALYGGRVSWTCAVSCLNEEKTIPLPFGDTLDLYGELSDVNGQSGGIDITLDQGDTGQIHGQTDSTGRFHLTGFAPGAFTLDGNGDPQDVEVELDKDGLPQPIIGTVQGTTREDSTGLLAPFVPFHLDGGNYSTVEWTEFTTGPYPSSGPNATFNIRLRFPDWHSVAKLPIHCDISRGRCDVTSPVSINTSRIEFMLRDVYWVDDAWWFWKDSPISIGHNETRTGVEAWSRMATYWVVGRVTDQTGNPIPNIKVKSPGQGGGTTTQATTAADGTYAIHAWLKDPWSRNSSNSGTLKVNVAKQTVSGTTYNSKVGEAPVPASTVSGFTPNAQYGDPPVVINLQLSIYVPSSGGTGGGSGGL